MRCRSLDPPSWILRPCVVTWPSRSAPMISSSSTLAEPWDIDVLEECCAVRNLMADSSPPRNRADVRKKGGGCTGSHRPIFHSVSESELVADLDAPDARLVDHRRQVVEVDRADSAFVVGDVA